MCSVKLGAREIVNAVFAFSNNVLDLVDPNIAGVARFKSTAGPESHVMHCEDNCAEKANIVSVKRAIDKYVLIKPGGSLFRHVQGVGRVYLASLGLRITAMSVSNHS